ncbi:CHAD domain-containing protein [Sphingobium sp.]|uniref:CYTH and CHAD domain-containing protein n=1 Tax=Sphingobium sp. TaxID=1912891 RepID=UPI003B3AC992
MPSEIELKLDVAPDLASAVLQWPLLRDLDGQTALLAATYFDTPDRLLLKNGISLRIRRSGQDHIQTVKVSRQRHGGLFMRDEWEKPVDSLSLRLDNDCPVTVVLGDAVSQLVPVFKVDVDRHIWLVEWDDALIEMVLDQGLVSAGRRQEPLCEVELELKRGDAAALFALARRMDADMAVRPGMSSKSERGYHLTDALPTAIRAERVHLHGGMDSATAFLSIATNCMRHYRLNEALLLDAYVPEALHQARVAIRRLRTAIMLFRPLLREEDVTSFQGELRWLAHIMADARDLDVLDVRTLTDADRVRLENARIGVRHDLMQWLQAARLRLLLIDLTEWLADGGRMTAASTDDVVPFAMGRLKTLDKRVAKGGRGLAGLDDAQRHRLRRDAKKLRYAAEYFTGLFTRKKDRRRLKKLGSRLGRLQNALGALNDLVMAPEIMKRHGLCCQPEVGDKVALLKAAAQAHDGFVDVPRIWR